jgi:hypothetical protein
MGFTIFGFVSAYVALRPRLKKLSLGALLKRRLGGRVTDRSATSGIAVGRAGLPTLLA